jgi:hypothetical protein
MNIWAQCTSGGWLMQHHQAQAADAVNSSYVRDCFP